VGWNFPSFSAGSGTTLIAAGKNNRYGVGLDIDEIYCELAKQRIIKESKMINYTIVMLILI
jgi:site-specific DNA-methyltransferase (adenine-specific)